MNLGICFCLVFRFRKDTFFFLPQIYNMAATSFPILILLLFPSFFYLQRKKKNTPIKVNFSKYLPIPLPRPPLVTILDATYHPPTSPLLFSLSPHSSLSASAKSQTSQPLSWVKRRKRCLQARQPCLQGASRVSAALWSEAAHRRLSLGQGPALLHWLTAFPPFIWVKGGREEKDRGN